MWILPASLAADGDYWNKQRRSPHSTVTGRDDDWGSNAKIIISRFAKLFVVLSKHQEWHQETYMSTHINPRTHNNTCVAGTKIWGICVHEEL